MKKNLRTLFFTLITVIAIAVSHKATAQNYNSNLLSATSVINGFDTVVFDLSQASVIANKVSFPVYFLSDDTINALDFSFKYDTANFAYDTTINLTTYMSVLAWQAADFKVRFTSSSLQRMSNDTVLAIVRFTMLSTEQFCIADMDTINAYLNGDACSYKVIECVPSGIDDINNSNNLFTVYPNPVANELTITERSLSGNKNAETKIIDVLGREIYSYKGSTGNLKINTSSWSTGIYTVKITCGTNIFQKRLVKE